MSAPLALTRRSFLVAFELSLAGLAVGIAPLARAASSAMPLAPNPFVHISPEGIVTLVCHRSEMGQGVRSTIPSLIASELGANLATMRVMQADGDKLFGDQNTDGSSSIRKRVDELRQVGAAAREMLIAAAAARWGVRTDTCDTLDGVVVHQKSKRTLPFGALASAAAKLTIPPPEKLRLRPWSTLPIVADAHPPLLDGPVLVTGTARFGADVTVPGMRVAVIARPPVVGGKVLRFDATHALQVPGVRGVFEMPVPKPPYLFQPWGGIAVVADNTWAAMKGRAALQIDWDDGENGSYDSGAFREELLASVRAEGNRLRNVGDVDAAFSQAARVLEAEYTVPHLAQLPMEPPCALARVDGDTCEVWSSTQNPQEAQQWAAKTLGIPEKNVKVHVTFLGGGFGRKSKADFVAEAAFLAKAAGAPVRVQWTREDDVRHGYYNSTNAQRLRAALDDKGKLVAWHQRTAFPSIQTTYKPTPAPTGKDLQQGVLDLALDAPNVRAEACKADAHVRIGWYRSVYNIFHAFASSSFVDEIAHARGADPRDVLLEVIGPPRVLSLKDLGIEALDNYGEPLDKHPVDAGRLRGVVERVTAMAPWRERGKRALGLAAHRSFVAYTAAVVSVVRDARFGVRVDEAWISIDAGRVVNHDRVRSQLEGAVVMGISNALLGGVTMKNGKAEQSNFRDAPVARIGDVPRAIHVDIVPSDAPCSGVGEPGVPPVGPALANAIFALTGQRIRDLPLRKHLA
jgi:isoquinoline 1-oxidoreductase beta subunit